MIPRRATRSLKLNAIVIIPEVLTPEVSFVDYCGQNLMNNQIVIELHNCIRIISIITNFICCLFVAQKLLMGVSDNGYKPSSSLIIYSKFRFLRLIILSWQLAVKLPILAIEIYYLIWCCEKFWLWRTRLNEIYSILFSHYSSQLTESVSYPYSPSFREFFIDRYIIMNYPLNEFLSQRKRIH